MRYIIFITGLVFLFFTVEFFLFNFVDELFLPNLLIILIVFFNFFLGIRYSLYTAFLSGLLKDSFSTMPFGVHLFSFIFLAYLTTLLKEYINYRESKFSQLVLIFCVMGGYLFVFYFLFSMSVKVRWEEVFWNIWLPETIMTVGVSYYVLKGLKQCVLRFWG